MIGVRRAWQALCRPEPVTAADVGRARRGHARKKRLPALDRQPMRR
jgi:hypothetical protein